MYVTKSQEGCSLHSPGTQPRRLEGSSAVAEIASLPLALRAKIRSGEEDPAERRF